MNPSRKALIEEVVKKRQINAIVILENIEDTHNIGAILRTCDSVGICEVHVYYTYDRQGKMKMGKRTTAGTRKWVDVYVHDSREECFNIVRSKVDAIFCTHLDEESKSIYNSDFTGSVAFLFGNEHAGVDPDTLTLCDGNLIVPQAGMSQSLNVGVACAVMLYEFYRQRLSKGLYDQEIGDSKKALLADYIGRSETRYQGKHPINKPKLKKKKE